MSFIPSVEFNPLVPNVVLDPFDHELSTVVIPEPDDRALALPLPRPAVGVGLEGRVAVDGDRRARLSEGPQDSFEEERRVDERGKLQVGARLRHAGGHPTY